jgi:threonine/homoserine/homoserine lactone efflux protein
MNIIFESVYQGLLLGLTLCIAIGPSFFALIQTSIRNGFQSGVALAVGIFLSDFVCVALAYLGASKLFDNPHNKLLIGVIGGTVLIVFGIYNMQKKTIIVENNIDIKKSFSVSLTVLKGFLLNILNPAVFLLWMGWMGWISARHDFTSMHVIIFFTMALLTVLATDVLKAYGAFWIRRYLRPLLLVWLNRVVGIIMICCGIWMIYQSFYAPGSDAPKEKPAASVTAQAPCGYRA